MCAICRSYPCVSRCPNAREPEPVYMCARCKEGIFEGEEYFDSARGTICMECMSEMTVSEVLELVGESLLTV